MPGKQKDIILSKCAQCERERHYDDMYDCLMNDGERVCHHCYTYQLAVRKNLQLNQQALNQIQNKL